MLVSIVSSFRNEEQTLPELLRRLRATVDGLGVKSEFIFVNDASNDRSQDILAREAAADSRVKVVSLSRRFGFGPGVIAGLEHAKGDAVLLIDADLQDPPELLPEMLAEFAKGYDVVYTTRLSRAGDSWFKMLLTKCAYRVLNYAGEVHLPIDSGDFKLMSRRVVQEVLRLSEHDPFIRGMVSWVGFRQKQIFYHRAPRYAGRSHFPLFGAGPVRAFVSGLASFSALPLELIMLIGIGFGLVAFLYLAAVLAMFLAGWNLPGWTAIMGVLLVSGGLQLITTGFIGIYISRIYNEVKKRPLYVVDQTLGFKKDGE